MTNERTTVTSVEPLDGHWVRVAFADGAIHEVDLADVFARGGVFAPIRDDRTTFEAVRVDPDFGTIVWPGDVDLDSDVLRGDQQPASGAPLPRRVVQPA
jgi:hypothetical protein